MSVLILIVFLIFFAAGIIEDDWKCRYWMVKGSQRVYVWYGCWRISAFKPMELSHLGAMCVEILTPLQGLCWVGWNDIISFWLWKGFHLFVFAHKQLIKSRNENKKRLKEWSFSFWLLNSTIFSLAPADISYTLFLFYYIEFSHFMLYWNWSCKSKVKLLNCPFFKSNTKPFIPFHKLSLLFITKDAILCNF